MTATARKKARAGRTATKRRSSPAPARVAAAPAAPRIARVAKGKKPQYFSDPAIDKLLWMTVTLMEELAVARDRLDAVERLLDRKRVLRRRDIEAFTPTPAEEAERGARRADYVDRVMRVLQAELEELSGKDMPRTEADMVAAVAS